MYDGVRKDCRVCKPGGVLRPGEVFVRLGTYAVFRSYVVAGGAAAEEVVVVVVVVAKAR